MKFVNLDETRLPLGALSDNNLAAGNIIKFEVEIVINEPTLYGFKGMVHSIRPLGIVYPRTEEDVQV